MNFGNVFGMVTGGICGYDRSSNLTICNCFNIGAITGRVHVGGIVACSRTLIANCYNVGNVSGILFVNEESDDYAIVGIGGWVKNLNNVFNYSNISADYSIIGAVAGAWYGNYEVQSNVYNVGGVAESLTGTYVRLLPTQVDTDIANLSVTVNGSTYTTLLTALNAWVDANKATYPELKNWVMGDNGYPTFAD